MVPVLSTEVTVADTRCRSRLHGYVVQIGLEAGHPTEALNSWLSPGSGIASRAERR